MSLSGGHDLGSLNAMAAADAAVDHWSDAVSMAQAALDLARQPGAPTGAEDVCRARLENLPAGTPAFALNHPKAKPARGVCVTPPTRREKAAESDQFPRV